MSVPSSVVCIENRFVLASWYQNPPNSTGIPVYKEQDTLGKGASSEVVKVAYEGREWALKRPLNEKAYESIRREANLLIPLNQEERKAKQEYLVQLVAFMAIENTPMTLLPLYSGDLFSRIENSTQGLSLESTVKITEQMLKALLFLKDQGVFHRDIKPENIFMVGNDDTIRIGDLGLAIRKEEVEKSMEIAGTPAYQSPEFLRAYYYKNLKENPFDFPCDMWAVGYVAFVVFSCIPLVSVPMGESPNIQKLRCQQINLVRNFDIHMDEITTRKGVPSSDVLTVFRNTVKDMLAFDPLQRLTPESGVRLWQERVSPMVIGAEEFV